MFEMMRKLKIIFFLRDIMIYIITNTQKIKMPLKYFTAEQLRDAAVVNFRGLNIYFICLSIVSLTFFKRIEGVTGLRRYNNPISVTSFALKTSSE